MAINWTPFTLSWDDNVPIDLSFVFEHEKPAGKHGFLAVFGDRFVFEDGTEGRFWGTNFNSGANFPSHATSEMVARRLGKFGVNIMRTHQMDAEWATPNIFTANRARPKDNTRSLDVDSLDRLDYLIHSLKQEGVYTYLDLLTYRQFLPGDAVDACGELKQAAKPYMYFDRRLIELQKEFNEQLWGHVNPYTGLAYKDDPAIVLSELVNEADLFVHPVSIEPYRTRFEAMYRAWLDEQDLKQPEGGVDFTQHTPEMGRFFVVVMANYNREMTAHLRKIGVKIPITGTNWSTRLGVTAAQAEMDFNDSHVYWEYPWADPVGAITRKAMVTSANNDYAALSFMRAVERPFFVSEWDHAYPAEYRAESSLTLAAVSAFQGWGGCTIHTYRYSTWEPENRLAGGSSTINGIVYRNFFDSFNDPAKFGLFYQAALLLRRGDVQPGKEMTALRVADEEGWELKGGGDLPGLNVLPEMHRMGIALPGEEVDADEILPAEKASVDTAAGEVLSDTGELYRSWVKRFGWIDTPRSKVAYGFLGEQGKIELKGLELDVRTDYAVVALGSLTDQPLEDSPSILVTAVGRCQNSEIEFSEDGNRMLHSGKHPMLIEPIEATIRLRTQRPGLKVFVISEHGELVCRLPVEYENGVLSFQIGMQPEYYPSTMYYLIRI
jgi:hypothetical protein